MLPFVEIARATTPDGSELSLHERDGDYFILSRGDELMSSRRYASEEALGELGCRPVKRLGAPSVLVAGLGIGFTLRSALDALPGKARVLVVELIPEVVRWNREIYGHLTGNPLADPRVEVVEDDVLALARKHPGRFDAILMDVDNGPEAFTDSGNDRLYGYRGLRALRSALTAEGALSLWSVRDDHGFVQRMEEVGFDVVTEKVKPYEGAKRARHIVWVATKRPLAPRRSARDTRGPGAGKTRSRGPRR